MDDILRRAGLFQGVAADDVEALRDAVADGTIDAIATENASAASSLRLPRISMMLPSGNTRSDRCVVPARMKPMRLPISASMSSLPSSPSSPSDTTELTPSNTASPPNEDD